MISVHPLLHDVVHKVLVKKDCDMLWYAMQNILWNIKIQFNIQYIKNIYVTESNKYFITYSYKIDVTIFR